MPALLNFDEMALKVFWAWQSDLPGKTGRHFIKDALLSAIDRINQSRDIEEPDETLQSGMYLDHDRKGLSGSPDLANEILRKIDASTIFVGDVTPVGRGIERKNDEGAIEQKPLMNPNVAIELGYALKAVSTNNILMIMNSHYGSRVHLPFDLAHKGGPITYTLPPDADKKTLEIEKGKLTGMLVEALRLFAPKPLVQPFEEMKAKIGRGIFFSDGEILGKDENNPAGRREYTMPFRKVMWLRVIPTKRLSMPLPIRDLRGRIAGAGPFGYAHTDSLIRKNAYGFALFNQVESDTRIGSLSQYTREGEIWGVNAELLLERHEEQPRFVFTQPIEDIFLQTLRNYMDLIRQLGKVELPVQIEAGIEGVSGRIISHTGRGLDNTLVMHKDSVVHRGTLATFEVVDQEELLLEFFQNLNNNTGVLRPSGLYGRG
jgi:hypothetical protein